ncbi:bactericidal permeability-increasing protein-like isoform X2 [Physella acuta]|uniref:bactericidal permeability-increasing protein-like isoform X2 n=1 Tax=Physella acuta TaxID=109671 RepID=UPI0027DB60C8|nr:bactericidal permeability-increasing protein-like isoform X2 [Physella acuta]
MKMKQGRPELLFILGLIVLATDHVTSLEPGAKLRLTKAGVIYANTVAQTALGKQLQTLKIDDQSGSSGDVSYRLTNIQTRHVAVPSSSMTLNPDLDGLSWSLSGFGLSLTADWWAKYNGIIPISDSGSVDIGISSVSLSVTVGLGVDASSRPMLVTKSCGSSIGDVSLDFHGGSAWIYNIFKDILAGMVKDALNGQICTLVTKAINVDAEAQLAKMNVYIEIDNRFLLDYGLIAPVTFTADYMESLHKGEVYWITDKKESPLTPERIPPWGDYSRMLYLWVTEYTANTMAQVAQDHGYLQYNLTAKDLPADSKYILNTTCTGMCIGTLIPQIRAKYPNSVVEIHGKSSSTPLANILDSGLNLGLLGDLVLYARTPDGNLAYLLTLAMKLSLNGTAFIDSEKVKGNITAYSFKVSVIDSAVGDVSEFALNLLLNAALKLSVIPSFNKMAENGFELPITGDIRFQSSKITFLDGVLLVSTDVQYITQTEQVLQFASESDFH